MQDNHYPEIRTRLINWGAKDFKYTDNNGRIVESRYLHEKLRNELKNGFLGELPVPEDLLNLLSKKNFTAKTHLGLLSAMMGYGHRRTANAFAWCAKSLGINTTEICFGDQKQPPITSLDKIFMAINKEYFRASNNEAVKSGMLLEGEGFVPNYKTGAIGKLATWLRIIMPQTYNSIFLGKTGKHISEKSVYTARKYLRHLFMTSITDKLKKYQITDVINFYPLLNFLLNKEAVTVATDAVVNPLGWTPLVRQVLERKEAMAKFSGFGKKLQENLQYGNGFAAPLAGLIKARHLTETRARKLKNGWPLTIVLLASQVATAQLESFKELIHELNDYRIVVQCGDGVAGEALKRKLQDAICNPERIILYCADSPTAAIEFWEIMAGCDIPLALAVKGSELSRMAVELHIPHIALGAIGEQELWNLTIGLIQGAPLILTTKAYYQIVDFIHGENFKEHERDWLMAKVEMAKADNYTKAAEKAENIAKMGSSNMVPVQRDFMLKVLDFVFTGKKNIFYA